MHEALTVTMYRRSIVRPSIVAKSSRKCSLMDIANTVNTLRQPPERLLRRRHGFIGRRRRLHTFLNRRRATRDAEQLSAEKLSRTVEVPQVIREAGLRAGRTSVQQRIAVNKLKIP